MERLWTIVAGGLALVAVTVVMALAPLAARADEGTGFGAAGNVTLEPAYQIGNAQGDGSGQ